MGSAVAEAIESQYEAMRGYCRSKFANKQDAEDLLHDAITKALYFTERNPDFRAGNWNAWLWRILDNCKTDAYRSKGKKAGTEVCMDMHEETLCDHTDILKDVTGEQDAEILQELIVTKLPHLERIVIICYHYEKMRPRDIARHLFPERAKISAEQKVQRHMRKGHVALRRALRKPDLARHFGE